MTATWTTEARACLEHETKDPDRGSSVYWLSQALDAIERQPMFSEDANEALRIVRALAESDEQWCHCDLRADEGRFTGHYDTCLYRLKKDAQKLRRLVPCEHLSRRPRQYGKHWGEQCTDCGRRVAKRRDSR